jgi:type II restriction/modification system DNA methylase subunit YeeA
MAMKARLYYRRFFKTTVKTNILELNDFGSEEFKDIKTFGSLLTPDTKNTFDDGVFGQNIPEYDLQIKLLTGKFHCVITNPPYMGGGGMNPLLGDFVKNRYPEAKSDLFSAFMIRNTELTLPQGQLGFMTPFVWMFISSYEKLRAFLIDEKTITSLIQLEYSAFDGATVPICTFTLENSHKPNYLGGYIKLSDFKGSENQAPKTLEAIRNKNCGWFYGVSAFNFKKIPSSPISYWASPDLMSIFENSTLLSKLARPCQGMATTNNGLFLRNWFEVTSEKVGLSFDSEEAANISKLKWFPYNKGGDFRKWYGNAQYVINFENKGQTICDYIDNTPNVNVGSNGRVINRGRFFKESISWSKISSSNIALRYYPKGFIFDVAGTSIFADKNILLALIGFMNSFVSRSILSILSPTLNFEVGHINSLPVVNEVLASLQDKVNNITIQLINIEKQDWDSYESSWDFSSLPLLQNEYKKSSIEESYKTLRAFWQTQIDTMKKLEEENNDIFIKAYGLEDEIKLEVPLKEITLTCNPSYRYDHKKSDEELESLLLADTMKELISYGVGCMFGRYSLDKPGLILANQGDTIGEYLKEISNSTFPIDDDNIIPILEDDFFTDDIASRFIEFIKVAFGEEHHAKNIQFIEDAIGKSIRKYFVKGFYDDHIKRYKKRPIYWMVSSPKKSFNALIYMHRYQDDIFARVQNNYLREYITKLEAAMHTATTIANDESNSAVDRRKATKDIETITKKIDELIKFDRDKLTPFAQSRTPIDLDDGVKVNYSKFEEILYPIPGLKSEE